MLALVVDDAIVDVAEEGQDVAVILDKTPFYAESGGQVGDCGIIQTEGALVEIRDCTKFGGNKFIHTGVVKSGELNVGDTAVAAIDTDKRLATARNHTTTHLLQKALRTVLGTHVEQAGSLVTPTRLRFDFTHFEAISREDLMRIERIVNESILDAHPVNVSVLPIEEAKKLGAMALFGEKYGDRVRVVNIDDYSIEFCGGTHLKNTAQAGSFKILTESSVAAGVRRIEAVTGFNALNFYEEQEYSLLQVRELMKAGSHGIAQKLAGILEENKKLAREVEKLKGELAGGQLDEMLQNAVDVDGKKIVCARVDDLDTDALRQMGDQLRNKLGSGALVLADCKDGKVTLLAMATDDAVKAGVHAGKVVKELAAICGGGGGGKPNMAQAGGKDITKVNEALERARELFRGQLGL